MAGQLIAHRWVDLCGAVTSLAYLWLATASETPPVPLVPFFGALAVAWVALLALMAHFRGDRYEFPVRRMILWCLVFRIIGLVAQPVLEDDHYRYLWDGRSFALTGSPYTNAPADHFDDPTLSASFERVLDGINNPDIPSLYPPMAELLFLVSYWIAPGEFIAIKLLLILADLATLLLLLKLVKPRYALLYAWCPLLIQETAFTGHVDTLGVFFLVAAIYARTRSQFLWVPVYLALAIATKFLAVLLLPFLLLRVRMREWALLVPVLGILYLPLAVARGPGEGSGFAHFLAEWEFNSTGFALLANFGGPVFAKIVGAACVGAVCIALLVREHQGRTGSCSPPPTIPRGDLLLICFFLFAPVVNPWYLLWLLPFVCVYPSAWGIAALAAVSLCYAHGLFLVDSAVAAYHHPAWVRPAELGLIAVCTALWRGWSSESVRHYRPGRGQIARWLRAGIARSRAW